MAQFPSLPLFTDAYLGDTTHLTTIEHGAYLLLLITMWRNKCVLPNDDKLLARYARLTPAQWTRIKPVLWPFFEVSEDTISQARLTDEAYYVKRKSKQSSDAAKARWLKNNEKDNADAMPERCPPPHPTSNISEPKGSSYGNGISKPSKPKPKNGYSEYFDTEFWKPYPRTPTMSKQEAWKQWKKLPAEDRVLASNALQAFIDYCKANPDYPVVHACRFLSQRRFDGFAEQASVTTEGQREADEKLRALWADAGIEIEIERN